MKEFLFSVILSFLLLLGVALVATYVPGARYVFAFCGVFMLLFVGGMYYERRLYRREARRQTSSYAQAAGRAHRSGQAHAVRVTVRE